MRTVAAGKQLIDLIKLCYKADQPVLLVGKHGVGKSELIEQAAAEMAVGFICRDLSLMEPPDLVGMPKDIANRTHYSPPSFLPSEGNGLLVFEELNRCPNYIRAPCLQLLTARTLNDYVLPKGWLPCAAINPSDESYDVQELDPALVSRFVAAQVRPSRKDWLEWGKNNNLHPSVLTFVGKVPKVFAGGDQSNPRAWYKVSRILSVGKLEDKITQIAISGLVGDLWCENFLSFFAQEALPPSSVQGLLDRLCNKDDNLTDLVDEWVEKGRTDFLETVAYVVNLLLQSKEDLLHVLSKPNWKLRFVSIVTSLPPDLVDMDKFHKLVKGGKK